MPLIFRHGAAEVAFDVVLAFWLVFEFVMRVRQRLRAAGPAAQDPTAFVLIPSLAAAIIAAEALGRKGRLSRSWAGWAWRSGSVPRSGN